MPRVIITVPEKSAQPYRFQLDRKVVSIGRGSENDIVIDSGSVSGMHAEMRRVEGGYELADLGSTNGIKRSGIRELVVPLESGRTLQLGDVDFDFTLEEEEMVALQRERPAALDEVRHEAKELPPERGELPPGRKELPPVRKKLTPVTPRPPEERRERERKNYEPVETGGGWGFGSILVFLILTAAAFYAGLEVRHQRETGETLLKGIVNKSESGEGVERAESVESVAEPVGN